MKEYAIVFADGHNQRWYTDNPEILPPPPTETEVHIASGPSCISSLRQISS